MEAPNESDEGYVIASEYVRSGVHRASRTKTAEVIASTDSAFTADERQQQLQRCYVITAFSGDCVLVYLSAQLS